MEHLLFVINPISGDIDKEEIRGFIRDRFPRDRFSIEFYETTGEKDLEKLAGKRAGLKEGILIAIGGDGTTNLVAQAVMKTNLRMAIVPAGSANGMARDLSIPVDFHEALNLIEKGKTRLLDILRLNEDFYSLHLSDLGFNARIIRKFERLEKRGLLSYAKLFFNELFNLKEHRYIVHAGNKKVSSKATMLLIANSTRYGTGAVVNPVGKPDDGMAEIILFKPYGTWQILRMFIPTFTGKLDKLKFVEVLQGKEFLIENHDRQIFQVDGEPIGRPEKVHMVVIPSAVNVIVPA